MEASEYRRDVHRYDVEVLHLVVSPGHNYSGRPGDGPGDHPTYDLDEVRLIEGKGIVGDRFYGKAAHVDAAVTLFAVEALEAVAAQVGLDAVPDPLLVRRNVVLRGADVNGLRGYAFALESVDGPARTELLRRQAGQPLRLDGPRARPRRARGSSRAGRAALPGRGGRRYCGEDRPFSCRRCRSTRPRPAAPRSEPPPCPDPAPTRESR